MTPARSSSLLSTDSNETEALALEAELPFCDGRPMSDSDLQYNVCAFEIVQPARWYHRNREIYIASNMVVYYRRPPEGADFDLVKALDDEDSKNPEVVAPDVFAVRGVSKRARKSFQVEAEGRGPEFVIEVASASTVARDLGSKREIYERYGVLEYMLYDPTDEGLLSPRLQFFERVEGRFVRAEPNERGRFFSEVLDLEFAAAEDGLRFYERGQESPLLRAEEAREAERQARVEAQARERSERQAKVEAQARERSERQAKEAERQAKEAALERVAAESQAKEAERQAKEAALSRESDERQAKEAALEELEALRRRLAQLEGRRQETD